MCVCVCVCVLADEVFFSLIFVLWSFLLLSHRKLMSFLPSFPFFPSIYLSDHLSCFFGFLYIILSASFFLTRSFFFLLLFLLSGLLESPSYLCSGTCLFWNCIQCYFHPHTNFGKYAKQVFVIIGTGHCAQIMHSKQVFVSTVTVPKQCILSRC